MSAGRGVVHAEWNASHSAPVRFIQVWLLPTRPDTAPSWEWAAPGWRDKPGPVLVASGDGRDGSLRVGSDADVYAARLSAGHGFTHALRAGRGAWLQVLDGRVSAGASSLEAGDGLAISETDSLELRASQDAELLLFDLA